VASEILRTVRVMDGIRSLPAPIVILSERITTLPGRPTTLAAELRRWRSGIATLAD
jgi:hypothetical protein